MNTAEIADVLRRMPFCDDFPAAELKEMAARMRPQEYQRNDIIFHEGGPRGLFGLVARGVIAIEKGRDGGTAGSGGVGSGGSAGPAAPVRLATLGPGEALGEGLLLDEGSTHGTTARVLEPSLVLTASADAIRALLAERPSLYALLVARAARTVAQRLRSADATLVGRGRALGFSGGRRRRERDLLGEREVPDDALYGVQTLRALENFPITGVVMREFPALVEALAAVKEAAALANCDLGLLDARLCEAIVAAAREIRAGRHHEHFLVDMMQGGAGTSSNMNANEVIANRALELLGERRGSYHIIHPNTHVNLSQSTNDVYPTALKLALHASIDWLKDSLRQLARVFLKKGEEFAGILKMGRTQLQDAVPMTLGQEFSAFGNTLLEDVDRLTETQALIREINMGATAIGTGINTPPGYAEAVRRHLSDITGLELVTAPDLVEATADTGVFVQLSGVLKRTAVKLSKICNDLRLLSSGPRAGLSEINLPPMQPGSSIMPGKVNPVIPEVVNQVCFDVIGGDVTVTMAAEAGQLQLNVFEPVIAFRLLRGMLSLRNACDVLRERCVTGISANTARLRWFVENSIGIVTALVPVLGYDRATEIAKEALESGRSVYDVVCERGLMTRAELEQALNPLAMTAPRQPE